MSHPYKEIGVGWGHKARLWDVRFITMPTPGNQKQQSAGKHACWGLITSSEDTTAKLWSIPPECDAETGSAIPLACQGTFRGHAGRHVWRVAAHPLLPLVSTGGNDSSAKLWYWPMHCENPVQEGGTATGHMAHHYLGESLSPLPLFPGAHEQQGGETARCLAFVVPHKDDVPHILLATTQTFLPH